MKMPLITLRMKKKASFVFKAAIKVPPLRRTSDKVDVKPNPMISQKIKTVSTKVCVFIFIPAFLLPMISFPANGLLLNASSCKA